MTGVRNHLLRFENLPLNAPSSLFGLLICKHAMDAAITLTMCQNAGMTRPEYNFDESMLHNYVALVGHASSQITLMYKLAMDYIAPERDEMLLCAASIPHAGAGHERAGLSAYPEWIEIVAPLEGLHCISNEVKKYAGRCRIRLHATQTLSRNAAHFAKLFCQTPASSSTYTLDLNSPYDNELSTFVNFPVTLSGKAAKGSMRD